MPETQGGEDDPIAILDLQRNSWLQPSIRVSSPGPRSAEFEKMNRTLDRRSPDRTRLHSVGTSYDISISYWCDFHFKQVGDASVIGARCLTRRAPSNAWPCSRYFENSLTHSQRIRRCTIRARTYSVSCTSPSLIRIVAVAFRNTVVEFLDALFMGFISVPVVCLVTGLPHKHGTFYTILLDVLTLKCTALIFHDI